MRPIFAVLIGLCIFDFVKGFIAGYVASLYSFDQNGAFYGLWMAFLAVAVIGYMVTGYGKKTEPKDEVIVNKPITYSSKDT